MTKVKRTELETLSKALKGTTSYWQKLMKGSTAEMEETMDDGTIRKYKGIRYPTLEEVETKMKEDLTKKIAEDKLKEEKLAAHLEKEKLDALNKGLTEGTVTSVDPVSGLSLDEIRREGTYE